VPRPRIQLTARARQRLTSHLDRLARELSNRLATAVNMADAGRVTALQAEIRDYALALLRARMGLLSPSSRSDSAPPSGAATTPRSASRRASSSPAPPPSAAAGASTTLRRNGRNYEITPPTLKRFCELTGVSESHIGGCGSNLAGIAFYFAVFAILTSGTELPLESIRQLLDQLREAREQIDAFVVHWLNTSGWQWQDATPRELNRWFETLGRLSE